ncbi:MAG: CPBP family intramembrane glutamic endopeptidase [Candidatus Thorarchaeota archaeon]
MKKSNVVEIQEEINQQISFEPIKQRSKLIAGIVLPPIMWVGMFAAYQLYGLLFGSEIGWYLGLFTYWMLCGLLFPMLLIGVERIKRLSAPRKLKLKVVPAIIFPTALAFILSSLSGWEYSKVNWFIVICLIITAFGNGIFEEIVWRGVYMELYPKNYFLRIGYSTFWYAVFHFASGSLSSNRSILSLVIGSVFFGIYLSLLAKWTDNIWWGILCHILGGLVIVV